jgi:hypothetical protein
MKKFLYHYVSVELFFESCFVYETEKSYVLDYYINRTGSKVGKSYFRKSSKITDVLKYWEGDDFNIIRVLLEEFFGNGYRNLIHKVF